MCPGVSVCSQTRCTRDPRRVTGGQDSPTRVFSNTSGHDCELSLISAERWPSSFPQHGHRFVSPQDTADARHAMLASFNGGLHRGAAVCIAGRACWPLYAFRLSGAPVWMRIRFSLGVLYEPLRSNSIECTIVPAFEYTVSTETLLPGFDHRSHRYSTCWL